MRDPQLLPPFDTAWLRRQIWRWQAPLWIVVGLVYLAGLNGHWRITSDGAVYVEAARLLTEGGPTVIDPGMLSRVQPGLGWMLAFAGGPGLAIQGLMLAIAGLCLWMYHRLIKLLADGPTASCCTLVLAVAGLFHELSFALLTEMPFTAGLLLLLWGHERRVQRRPGRMVSLVMIVGGLAVMATFRSVAAVVAAAYVLAELIRLLRSPGRALGLGLIAVMVGGAAAYWWASPAMRDDVSIFLAAVWPIDLGRLSFNASQLINETLPEAVTGQDVPPPGSWLVTAVVLLIILSFRQVRLLWLVLGAAFVLQWLIFTTDSRYVLPLLPLLVFGGWRLLLISCQWLGPRWGRHWFRTVLTGVVGANLVAVVLLTIEQRREDFYAGYKDGDYLPMLGAAEWLTTHTPEDTAVAMELRDAMVLAVLARRPVVDPVAAGGWPAGDRGVMIDPGRGQWPTPAAGRLAQGPVVWRERDPEADRPWRARWWWRPGAKGYDEAMNQSLPTDVDPAQGGGR